MRIALIVAVLLAAMAGGAYWASRRLIDEQRPPAPPPQFLVTAEANGRVVENERRVALPLEEALAAIAGVTRLRTRTTATSVAIEVWATPGTAPHVPGATVTRLDLPPDAHWLARGEQRPAVLGEVCGREAPVATVMLDPLKLQALHVGALDVDRRLKGPLELEQLGLSEVAAQVRLRDLATLELKPPPARCLALAGGEPVFLVTTRQSDVEGATRLDPVTRLDLEGPVPKLEAVTPAVVTLRPPRHVTLWFSPPLTAVQRAAVLAELRKQPGLELRHVDGVRKLRLVLSGNADHEVLVRFAQELATALSQKPGAELVVGPLPPEPFVNVKVDLERAAQLGVPAADVEALVALARRGSEHDGLRVTVPLAEPEHLGALALKDRRLAELVVMTAEVEPPELYRVDRQRAVEVVAYGLDRKAAPKAPVLPVGVRLEIREEL